MLGQPDLGLAQGFLVFAEGEQRLAQHAAELGRGRARVGLGQGGHGFGVAALAVKREPEAREVVRGVGLCGEQGSVQGLGALGIAEFQLGRGRRAEHGAVALGGLGVEPAGHLAGFVVAAVGREQPDHAKAQGGVVRRQGHGFLEMGQGGLGVAVEQGEFAQGIAAVKWRGLGQGPVEQALRLGVVAFPFGVKGQIEHGPGLAGIGGQGVFQEHGRLVVLAGSPQYPARSRPDRGHGPGRGPRGPGRRRQEEKALRHLVFDQGAGDAQIDLAGQGRGQRTAHDLPFRGKADHRHLAEIAGRQGGHQTHLVQGDLGLSALQGGHDPEQVRVGAARNGGQHFAHEVPAVGHGQAPGQPQGRDLGRVGPKQRHGFAGAAGLDQKRHHARHQRIAGGQPFLEGLLPEGQGHVRAFGRPQAPADVAQDAPAHVEAGDQIFDGGDDLGRIALGADAADHGVGQFDDAVAEGAAVFDLAEFPGRAGEVAPVPVGHGQAEVQAVLIGFGAQLFLEGARLVVLPGGSQGEEVLALVEGVFGVELQGLVKKIGGAGVVLGREARIGDPAGPEAHVRGVAPFGFPQVGGGVGLALVVAHPAEFAGHDHRVVAVAHGLVEQRLGQFQAFGGQGFLARVELERADDVFLRGRARGVGQFAQGPGVALGVTGRQAFHGLAVGRGGLPHGEQPRQVGLGLGARQDVLDQGGGHGLLDAGDILFEPGRAVVAQAQQGREFQHVGLEVVGFGLEDHGQGLEGAGIILGGNLDAGLLPPQGRVGRVLAQRLVDQLQGLGGLSPGRGLLGLAQERDHRGVRPEGGGRGDQDERHKEEKFLDHGAATSFPDRRLRRHRRGRVRGTACEPCRSGS